MKAGDIAKRRDEETWFVVIPKLHPVRDMYNAVILAHATKPDIVGVPSTVQAPGAVIEYVPDDQVPERIWAALAKLKLEGKI